MRKICGRKKKFFQKGGRKLSRLSISTKLKNNEYNILFLSHRRYNILKVYSDRKKNIIDFGLYNNIQGFRSKNIKDKINLTIYSKNKKTRHNNFQPKIF